MTFLSPIWLSLLAPWIGLVVWLLLGRHHMTRVPFIELWRGAVERPRASRQFAPPPLSLIAILTAMLLAILAAAGPAIRRGRSSLNVTVVLDRGVSMAPQGRRAEVIDAVHRAIDPKVSVTFTSIPAATASNWNDLADLSPTCVDTASQLNAIVNDLLARASDPVVVLTDQPVRENPRLIVIAPNKPVVNVAITRFAAREKPTTQAMVTLRNDSALDKCNLKVETATQPIELPPTGQERSYFVDLPVAGIAAQASIDAPDDFDGDNAAYLARQPASPRLEPGGALPPKVQRVITAYQAARPPSSNAMSIKIVTAIDQIAEHENGIICPIAVSQSNAAVTAIAHPITQHLNPEKWDHLAVAAPPTGADWTPILQAGQRPLISIREHPARQVWIGVSSPTLARSPDFVILWTNAIDWVANASSQTFASTEVGMLGPHAQPLTGRALWSGYYREDASDIVAANAPPARFRVGGSTTRWREKLSALFALHNGEINLAPYLCLAAIGSILLAIALWPATRVRGILTAFSTPRTV